MNVNEEQVGFVGLGHLGGTMARRLAGAGCPLVVFDADDAHVQALTDAGAEAAGSAREVAERADVVFTCLPSEEAAGRRSSATTAWPPARAPAAASSIAARSRRRRLASSE